MKFNDLNLEDWKYLEIDVNSLWIINERDKSGKHKNIYHGNFIPQRVDLLSSIKSQTASIQAENSFDSSLRAIALLIKINDLSKRILKGIANRFKDDEETRLSLMDQYKNIY